MKLTKKFVFLVHSLRTCGDNGPRPVASNIWVVLVKEVEHLVQQLQQKSSRSNFKKKDDDQYRSYLNKDRLSSPPKKYVAQSTYRIKASQLHKLQSDFTDPENDNH